MSVQRLYLIFGTDKISEIQDMTSKLSADNLFFACSVNQKRSFSLNIPEGDQRSNTLWSSRTVVVMETELDTDESEVYTQARENAEWYWVKETANRAPEVLYKIPDDAIRLYWFLGLSDADTQGKTAEQLEAMYQSRTPNQ